MTASLSPLNYTLKLSSHDLKIKTGRYDNLPRSNRKCNLCNRTEIEDENQFVLFILLSIKDINLLIDILFQQNKSIQINSIVL